MNDSNTSAPVDPQQKRRRTIKGVMLCRIIILTLLLTITFLFQLSDKTASIASPPSEFYTFICVIYLFTILYAALFKFFGHVGPFASVQMVIDHFLIAGLIYYTGGKESAFPMAYIFCIIGSSILFYQRGAFLSASLSSLLYGLLLLFQFHGWIHPVGQVAGHYEAGQVFHSMVLFFSAFYIVAFLSGRISEELKKNKKELIEKQNDYTQLETFNRHIIQSLDSGLLTIDPEGRINFLNRTAEKILNDSGDRLKRLSAYDLFPSLCGVIDRIKRKGFCPCPEYQRYETPFVTPSGRTLFLGFSISPLMGHDGTLLGYTLIFQDITRFKEMEEEIKRVDKLAAIGQLAAGMAHEIRNPLTSLSGSIQVLKSELVLDHPGHRLMDIALRESERLNALISDFLLFAQPPRGNKTLCRIGPILDETVDLFLHCPEYTENLHILRPPNPDGFEAVVDPDQMRQVFWNLMINAAQAMSGQGELRLDIGRGKEQGGAADLPWSVRDTNKQWIRISIADSGCGIAEDARERIFDPFFTTKDGGTGLGLSIVHKIIENHGGIIKVESAAGKGTQFSLYLPAGRTQEGNA
jgi:two-component system, NtrC family, sensor histidine kinase PilS